MEAKSKAKIILEIEQHVKDFLAKGGKIKYIPEGVQKSPTNLKPRDFGRRKI